MAQRMYLQQVYRVGDLEKTEEYYKKMFGMKRLRYRDQPDVSNMHCALQSCLMHS